MAVETAHAKINLALHVTGQRDDGYHLIDSLVTFCALGDVVSVRRAETDSFAISGPFAADLDSSSRGGNLVVRARDTLRSALGAGPAGPVAIRLEKNLPVASGIGGGSADAAATLRALVRLWGPIAPDALHALGACLGADVPMCLMSRPLRARGIGAELEPLPSLPALWLVLVNPGVAVSTPAVFAVMEQRDNPPLSPMAASPSIDDLLRYLSSHRNDLQTAACRMVPAIDVALAALSDAGALLARMSGSGATCFGIFATRQKAEDAARALEAARPGWYVAATRTTGAERP